MTKRDGIRIITEMEAAEKLLARGYVKAECPHCKDVGHFVRDGGQYVCDDCEGEGWIWTEPAAQ